MSYIEKSVYRYLKKVITSGFKALFTRKFLIYTIFFLLVITTTTLTALVKLPSVELSLFGIPPENMIRYIFYFELAFSLAYILVGLFLAKTNTILHSILLVLIAAGITAGFYFLDNFLIMAIIAFVLFCFWMFFTISSAFSFSKNVFGSKITGSILFMGKKEGGAALFGGILTPLIIISMGLDAYILYQGIVEMSWIYMITGVIGFITGGFFIFTIWKLAKKDDVFYTILPFFYLITNTHAIQIVFRLVKGDVNYISWLNLIVSFFFLLNSISRYYRKIKNLDIDFLPKDREEKISFEASESYMKKNKGAFSKEEFFINDIFKFISDRGVIMLILGTALAYHSMILQIGFNVENIGLIFEPIQSGIVQTAHSITILFVSLVVIILIIMYYLSKQFRNYASPAIYRLNFLPPYEQLEKFIKDAKEGNIDWKLFARDMTVKIARKTAISSARLSIAAKEQSMEYAKKGIDIVKKKTTDVIKKTKDWRKRKTTNNLEEEEELEDNEF